MYALQKGMNRRLFPLFVKKQRGAVYGKANILRAHISFRRVSGIGEKGLRESRICKIIP